MDGWAIVLSFLISLLATLIGLLAILWIESCRRPVLQLKVGAPGGLLASDPLKRPECIWTHVNVRNRPIPRWLGWVYDSEPALSCAAWISFFTVNGDRVFKDDMLGRWSETPEPRIVQIKTEAGTVARILDGRDHVDIPPGEYTTLDIAVRIRGEEDCFGWNNESYVYNWRHPLWKLPKGRYVVAVRVKTGGKEVVERFLLANDGRFEDFRLEAPPSPPKRREART